MNTKIIFSIVTLFAITAIGTIGIIAYVPSVSSDVICNLSDVGCVPPGDSDINNVGQCKHDPQTPDPGKGEKQLLRSLCKGIING
jgi:hypothetical protein